MVLLNDRVFECALERVVVKYHYQRKLLRWNSLPLLKRMFRRRPKDPFPGVSLRSLAVEAKKLFGEHYSKDGFCCCFMDFQNKNCLPVLVFKGWYNGCCFMSRKAFDLNGSHVNWGIVAPYDECGLAALPSEHGINDARDLEEFFKAKTKEIGDFLRSIFTSDLEDNI